MPWMGPFPLIANFDNFGDYIVKLGKLIFILMAATIAYIGLEPYVVYSTSKLPPGPPRLLSMIFSVIPTKLPLSKAMARMHSTYGPVFSLYRGRSLVLVLGTVKAATEFLDKKGGIYSSRPRNVVVGDILSRNLRGVIMPYGKRWRNWRTLMQVGLGIESSNKYKVVQSFESAILLRDLVKESDNSRYRSHLRRFAISVVFCVGYGMRIEDLNDPLVVKNQKATDCFVRLSATRSLVESFPILLKLPRSMQWFAKEAYKQRELDKEMSMSIWNEVKRRVELGSVMPSISKKALEKKEDYGLNDLELAYGVSAPFGAGVGTTLATIDVFLLAMLNFPDIMRKAQEEIDKVVGRSQLPDFGDMNNLPYVHAVILETMRWRPIIPLGLAHASIADDECGDGTYVPKGTAVLPNIYAMSIDETMFPSPNDFRPERYMEIDKSDPNSPNSSFVFGFGRRICPGRHVAINSIFIVASRILWAFNVVPVKDAKGKPIIPGVDDFRGDFLYEPLPFSFMLQVREDVAPVIEEEYEKAGEEAIKWT